MGIIKKPSELEPKTALKGLIYGVPGGGKTTLALSAPKPVIIDIDHGLNRVLPQYQCNSVQVKTYDDIIAFLKEDLSDYESIVIDTAGKLVDLMCTYVATKEGNEKLVQRDGTLSMKGWGTVKKMFGDFYKQIDLLNKNLIFVSHEKEDHDGDNRILRPDISGSAKNDLIKELDFMGYLEVVGKKRTLHLAPSEKFYAKNSIGVDGFLIVGDIDKKNTFLSETLFAPIIKEREKRNEQKKEYEKIISDGTAMIAQTEPNAAFEQLSKMVHIWNSKIKLWTILKEKADKEGLVFDTKSNCFKPKEA